MAAIAVSAAGETQAAAPPAQFIDPPSLQKRIEAGELPPAALRLPSTPLVVPFARPGQKPGRHGGTLRLLMARPKDVRLMVVYGYARLVRFDAQLRLVPDILQRIDVDRGRVFTLHLRKEHRWSDGNPFTTEDFRYYWEDVATNAMLSPAGPPKVMLVDGKPPRYEILDSHTLRLTWPAPNPAFLPALAGPRPPFIYRPAHYLKRFHAHYFDAEALGKEAESRGYRNWAALHNKVDNSYKNDNVDLPSLQPWTIATKAPSHRFMFRRNPYFHRIDPNGRQLPYIDRVVMNIVDNKIVAAKTGTGESDLQARYLRFADYTFLRKNAKRGNVDVHLWRIGKGAHLALYPNLNVKDATWRALLQDVRFRRALSLAVHRRELNRVMYFGQAIEGQNTVLPDSPLYRDAYRRAWADFDPPRANRLLDEAGLTRRDSRGIRLLPDGRPADIIVETAGESSEEADALELVHDSWLKVGIKLHIKPSHRDVLRNRIYAGETLMALSSGLENGLATADTSPEALAPTHQTQYQWPIWGQYTETGGRAGAAPDMPAAKRLADLLREWRAASRRKTRTRIWHEMLALYGDQVFTIGLVSGTLQPVVVDRRLRNVPENGLYNWDPGAYFGIYEPDTFWFTDVAGKSAR
ncbi:MAG: ABC transporter substrate-binding protein [Alphaproteobacteria bacterium]|nr:ABC transporter substrate-binding protein [Alphaproteobacteria bacterium]